MVILEFMETTQNLAALLGELGHDHWVCNHNARHTIPSNAIPSVWQFLQDHPFGTSPSPYVEGGLPDGFPEYCDP